MAEQNYLSAYKLINTQLVLSNQKLKEDIKDKISMINELNDHLLSYREENKTLRDMVHKLLEQFKTITTIMISVRDQSESVFNVVYNDHVIKETVQRMRKPNAGLMYERRRTEVGPYVDDAAIAEEDDEDRSMEDYRTAISMEEEEELEEEVEQERSFSLPRSPLMKHLERRSRNRSIDESFETIDTNRVVKAARKSQEYLQGRDSRESKHSEDESLKESAGVEAMDISNTTAEPSICVQEATVNDSEKFEAEQQSILEASSFSEKSNVPSDHSAHSDLNPLTDQSLRPASIKRMASDSMLVTLIDRETTISNAVCSTPMSKTRRKNQAKTSIHQMSPLSPVPVVYLKPLTKANLSQHNISFSMLKNKENNSIKHETLDCSDKGSIESSDSKRPRRKAAPKVLKEPGLGIKMRRT